MDILNAKTILIQLNVNVEGIRHRVYKDDAMKSFHLSKFWCVSRECTDSCGERKLWGN